MASANPLRHVIIGLMTTSSHAMNIFQVESTTDKIKLNAELAQELCIKVQLNKDNKTLSITDSGSGMTRAGLDDILKSWSQKSSEVVNILSDDVSKIHRYGVTFCLASLVVDKVIVRTKHKDDYHIKCESQADGSFTVSEDDDGDQLVRGTQIILFLKEEQLAYLEEIMIKNLVNEHCEFISYGIYICTRKTAALNEAGKKQKGEIVEEESDKWQLFNKPKPFQPSKNISEVGPSNIHSVGHTGVGPWADNPDICKIVKGILGDKVGDVTIASEDFRDGTHCRISSERVLEMNANSAKVEDLKKIVETGQNDEAVKFSVELLFDMAMKKPKNPKKAHWKKSVARWKTWCNRLSFCCKAIDVIGAACAGIVPLCGGAAACSGIRPVCGGDPDADGDGDGDADPDADGDGEATDPDIDVDADA